MTPLNSACLILLAVMLAACKPVDKKPPATIAAPTAVTTADTSLPLPPQPAKLDAGQRKALMTAIFEDKYDAAQDQALIHIGGMEEQQYLLMKMESANQLDDGRTVVIVNGSPTDESGTELPAHMQEGVLNVYTLRRAGGMWTLMERYQNAATSGTYGNIGDVHWISLGEHRPGFLLQSHYTAFGNWVSNMMIFELAQDVQYLGNIPDGSGNSGTCGQEQADCWEVESSFRLAAPSGAGPRDLLVNFDEKHFRQTQDKDGADSEKLLDKTTYHTRYHFNGTEYVLASGKNPTRGF